MDKRKIKSELITKKVSDLIRDCSIVLPDDICNSISNCVKISNNEQEKKLLNIVLENARIAKNKRVPLCQDTGMSIFFVEMGKNLEIEGSINDIAQIINESVKSVYSEKKLRPSIIDDPLKGKNTIYNTPAFTSITYNNSDKINISFMAKGGGSENACAASVLAPTQGFNGIKNFVLGLVREKGINACPPLIIGLGIGGTLDHAVLESKKALLRKIGQRNPDPYYAQKEIELKNEINQTGIGVMGLGGSCTALEVFIKELPRHIASLPIAVSVLCHSARRGKITI